MNFHGSGVGAPNQDFAIDLVSPTPISPATPMKTIIHDVLLYLINNGIMHRMMKSSINK